MRTGINILKGKTALVAGSTSGIGLVIAEALAADGVNVVLNGLGPAAEMESEQAASITGAVIPVDGGWAAH